MDLIKSTLACFGVLGILWCIDTFVFNGNVGPWYMDLWAKTFGPY